MIKPIGDKILVKVKEIENKTDGGIIIPDASKDKASSKGTVVALGSGRCDETGRSIPFCVKVGDEIIFDKMAGTSIAVDGEDHVVLKEFNILGVME